MSSDDDSGFDKEAEREKLREKYENDRKDRENTRRMSELLLQGATMTGKHCDRCGDPIFRYDGQEFCPTCQHEAQQAEQTQRAQQPQQAQNGGNTDDDAVDADQAVETTRTDESTEANESTDADESVETDTEPGDRSPESSDEPRVEIDDIRVAGQHTDEQRPSDSPNPSRHVDRSNLRRPSSQQGGRGHARGNRDAGSRGRTPARSARDHGHGESDADLAPARESLVRNLTDLARRAEETDDVARARELLAATREAAEALDALDRANR